MNQISEQEPQSWTEQLRELLVEHQRISRWLDRLEGVTIDVPLEAATLVRDEYLTRIQEVESAVGERADDLRDAAADAVRRITDARDRIPVLRLRHAVGELDDTALTQHLAALQREAADAEAERGRLIGLLAEIERVLAPDDGQAPPRTKPSAQPDSVMDDAFGEWQGPAGGGSGENGASPSATPEKQGPEREEDGLQFLNSLPRSPSPGPARVPADSPKPARPTARPGSAGAAASGALTCKSCQSVNDARSWYCDTCGSELG
jgi:hypothetical protein